MSIVEPPIKVAGHVQIVCKHADGVEFHREEIDNLLTNAGRVWMHLQVYNSTAAGTIGSNYIALTTDTSAAAAADTTLASEITTGGLARVQATTNTAPTGAGTQTTLAKTFTATATHTAVQKSALFNAASGGTMSHEAVFTPVTLNNTDQVTITWTLTLT